MATITRAIRSLPGAERIARTPFGGKIIVHVTADQSKGAFGIWETVTPPRKGPMPHTHTREAEIFRVLEGKYQVRCGDEEFEAPTGSLIVLPPNVEHSWFNSADTPGRMLATVVPGGFEQIFLEIEATNADTIFKVAQIEARLGIMNEITRELGLN